MLGIGLASLSVSALQEKRNICMSLQTDPLAQTPNWESSPNLLSAKSFCFAQKTHLPYRENS